MPTSSRTIMSLGRFKRTLVTSKAAISTSPRALQPLLMSITTLVILNGTTPKLQSLVNVRCSLMPVERMQPTSKLVCSTSNLIGLRHLITGICGVVSTLSSHGTSSRTIELSSQIATPMGSTTSPKSDDGATMVTGDTQKSALEDHQVSSTSLAIVKPSLLLSTGFAKAWTLADAPGQSEYSIQTRKTQCVHKDTFFHMPTISASSQSLQESRNPAQRKMAA